MTSSFFNLQELESLVFDILPPSIYNYFAGGAGNEITLKNNITAYDSIKLHYRILRDVSKCTSATKILGYPVSSPILVAPMAFQKLAHLDGEVATARAVNKYQTILVVSTYSNCSFKEIAQEMSIPPWFQIYIYKNREITYKLVKLAEKHNYGAIVLTVDTPFYGHRFRENQYPLLLPDELEFPNLIEAGLSFSHIPLSQRASYFSSLLDPSVTWEDVKWLQSFTSLPIILKGIIHPKDASLAVQHGVAGLIVSNHGGRQLDTAPATIEVLPSIVRAVENKLEIFIDGGIRKGTDVLKALIMGAKAVLIGRPVLWGLAVKGEEGVSQVLRLLCEELHMAMALYGCTTIDQLLQVDSPFLKD